MIHSLKSSSDEEHFQTLQPEMSSATHSSNLQSKSNNRMAETESKIVAFKVACPQRQGEIECSYEPSQFLFKHHGCNTCAAPRITDEIVYDDSSSYKVNAMRLMIDCSGNPGRRFFFDVPNDVVEQMDNGPVIDL